MAAHDKLPELRAVVTRNGVPVADQAQGVRDFLAACGGSASPRDRLQCSCGCEQFFVTRVDFICTTCNRSYRD